MYNNESHDECPSEQGFFQCYTLRSTEINGHFDSGISQAITLACSYRVYLTQKKKQNPTLKNAQKHAAVSDHCFELNSPSLHEGYIKRSAELMFVFNSEYIQTSLPFQKGGMGKEEKEGMDKGF